MERNLVTPYVEWEEEYRAVSRLRSQNTGAISAQLTRPRGLLLLRTNLNPPHVPNGITVGFQCPQRHLTKTVIQRVSVM